MHLKDWMEHHRHNSTWIAEQIGVDASLVSRWLRAENLPSLTHANRIHRLTGGKVTSIDWENPPGQGEQDTSKRTPRRRDSLAAKHHFIWETAQDLHDKGEQMTGQQLAQLLNEKGFVTDYGSPYAGGRGIYRLVKSTWTWLHKTENNPSEASKVAHAFVKANGQLAW